MYRFHNMYVYNYIYIYTIKYIYIYSYIYIPYIKTLAQCDLPRRALPLAGAAKNSSGPTRWTANREAHPGSSPGKRRFWLVGLPGELIS